MMVSLVSRSRLWCWLLGGTGRTACRHKSTGVARNKPLKQWTLIVNPLSSLRVKLPCDVRVRPQDPLTYPDADRVFVQVSGVDRNEHRGLDLDNIEVRYDEESRQVRITSQNIDSRSCVEVTTPIRFDVNIQTLGSGCVNIKRIECDSCQIETEKGNSVLQSVKGHNVHIRTKGGKVVCLGTVHGNVDIHALAHSTVDIEKLVGTSINICTENGQLKAKYLYAESSSMSSAAGDVIVGSAHGDTKLHTERGNITVDSSDGCLMASTTDGTIDVYISQAGKVHLKSDNGSIKVKINANLEAYLQLAGARVNVSPEVKLQEIENTSTEGQTILKATINLMNETQRWIVAEARRGTVYLTLQDWLQSLKLRTT
ncbi:PREDICTED: protein FAM185A isoform X1 [Nanorana parkeri]|uniref:protein FAM185A isoform X1 n=1 Tax=Nanorana parkeri TaxID=125878 RepID=UPI00085408D0|nr:PREDICTED: protein FAM185A isoform X1 [Nanorana parkeri]